MELSSKIYTDESTTVSQVRAAVIRRLDITTKQQIAALDHVDAVRILLSVEHTMLESER